MPKIILYCFITLIITSCIKEVKNIKLPDNNSQKIVVECFISPESDSISATLSLSLPIFGDNTQRVVPIIENATVTLSDGTNSYNIPFVDSIGKYFSKSLPFAIAPGKTYYLTVTTIDGKTVSAKCTVPINAAIPTSFTIIPRSDRPNYSSTNLKVEWQDIPGEKNFYFLTIVSQDSTRENTYPQPLYLYNNILTDEQRDGKLIVYREDDVFSLNDTSAYFVLELLTMDYNAYEFKRTQVLNEDNGPFTTPVNVHSNIQNGLGVFGAYRKMVLVK
ncbi:MAG TPA: DUF4249 domain-containing protein [Cytophagaceae bacterium]|jgi:hypothetical protein